MPSGKKNYFRHHTGAFSDPKIQKAISLLGYEGYAYYFILLELLAKECEDEYKNPITIHRQTLKIVWRKHTKSCNKVVEKLQESGLFVATFKESFIEFDIPNLSKYQGNYTNKNQIKPTKERKGKERKGKERKININTDPKSEQPAPKFDLQILLDAYPCNKSKTANLKELKKVIKTQDDYDYALRGIQNYAMLKKGEERKYIKAFGNFIREKLWEQYAEDEEAEMIARSKKFLDECIARQESLNNGGKFE